MEGHSIVALGTVVARGFWEKSWDKDWAGSKSETEFFLEIRAFSRSTFPHIRYHQVTGRLSSAFMDGFHPPEPWGLTPVGILAELALTPSHFTQCRGVVRCSFNITTVHSLNFFWHLKLAEDFIHLHDLMLFPNVAKQKCLQSILSTIVFFRILLFISAYDIRYESKDGEHMRASLKS